jgi:hypothetical protein
VRRPARKWIGVRRALTPGTRHLKPASLARVLMADASQETAIRPGLQVGSSLTARGIYSVYAAGGANRPGLVACSAGEGGADSAAEASFDSQKGFLCI